VAGIAVVAWIVGISVAVRLGAMGTLVGTAVVAWLVGMSVAVRLGTLVGMVVGTAVVAGMVEVGIMVAGASALAPRSIV